MPRTSEFDVLLTQLREQGYADSAQMDAEARRLRAQAMRHYAAQFIAWLKSGEQSKSLGGAARHA